MVKVEVIKDEGNKRILKCQEGNRIWYQLWLTQLDMISIQRYFEGYIDNRVIKAWWLINLQQYYVFFYEKKGGKTRGVLGKYKANILIGLVK